MAQSVNSFVNQNWTGSGVFEQTNLYSSVGMEITIYTSDQYTIYDNYLVSTEASNKIDENVDYLT